MSRRLTPWLLMLPGIGWLTVFMIVPCVLVLRDVLL